MYCRIGKSFAILEANLLALAIILQCFFIELSPMFSEPDRTGPAGSTGWTANRTYHRSGLVSNPEVNEKSLETDRTV